MDDPRPHVGEPLALDLLNTGWMSADGPQDLLVDGAGVRCWLETNDLADRCEADERPATHWCRPARRFCGPSPTSGSFDERTQVLGHGRIRRRLRPGAARGTRPSVRDPERRAGWLAADDPVAPADRRAPDRIKQCAHPQCMLWFHDTSKNGTSAGIRWPPAEPRQGRAALRGEARLRPVRCCRCDKRYFWG